jgi:two-component system sensor histidine kinase YesM
LSNLADIMRYSISQIEVTGRLEEEITWLRKYLDLQQLRFRHNFTYTIENRGVSPGFRIYKLLFQPLVENALVHGFDPNVSGGLLDIRFERNGQGYLVATISDNGRGLGAESADGTGAIGLTNLAQRLAVYYSGNGTLVVEPRTGGGTCENPHRRGRARSSGRPSNGTRRGEPGLADPAALYGRRRRAGRCAAP